MITGEDKHTTSFQEPAREKGGGAQSARISGKMITFRTLHHWLTGYHMSAHWDPAMEIWLQHCKSSECSLFGIIVLIH